MGYTIAVLIVSIFISFFKLVFLCELKRTPYLLMSVMQHEPISLIIISIVNNIAFLLLILLLCGFVFHGAKKSSFGEYQNPEQWYDEPDKIKAIVKKGHYVIVPFPDDIKAQKSKGISNMDYYSYSGRYLIMFSHGKSEKERGAIKILSFFLTLIFVAMIIKDYFFASSYDVYLSPSLSLLLYIFIDAFLIYIVFLIEFSIVLWLHARKFTRGWGTLYEPCILDGYVCCPLNNTAYFIINRDYILNYIGTYVCPLKKFTDLNIDEAVKICQGPHIAGILEDALKS